MVFLPTVLESNPTDLRKIERDEERARRRALYEKDQRQRDLRWVLSDQRGLRIIQQILDQLNLRSSVFDGNALHMARRATQADLGRWLEQQILDLCPDLFLGVVKEPETTDGTQDES